MAVEGARRGASGPNKRVTLTKRKNTMVKKELLTLAPGDACRWETLRSMKMMISSQSQVHVTAFRGTEG